MLELGVTLVTNFGSVNCETWVHQHMEYLDRPQSPLEILASTKTQPSLVCSFQKVSSVADRTRPGKTSHWLIKFFRLKNNIIPVQMGTISETNVRTFTPGLNPISSTIISKMLKILGNPTGVHLFVL